MRATKRALFSWSQSAKANPTEHKEEGKKILHKVAKPAKHTVEQSRKAFQSLQDSESDRSAKLKEKFFKQIELAHTILSQTYLDRFGNLRL